MMLEAAKSNGLEFPVPVECDPYDFDDLEVKVSPNQDAEVFWSDSCQYFPPEPTFNLPIGIIASSPGEDSYGTDEISRGYTLETNEAGMTSIEVNVESAQLMDLYSKLLQLHNSYRVFWYILHDHWDNEEDNIFLVNEALNSPEKISFHLNSFKINSIRNGYVTLTSYLEEGTTNLSISDHKRIIIDTFSSSIVTLYLEKLNSLGYLNNADLVSIDHRIGHWHYRETESLSRPELEIKLKELGFSEWKRE